MLKNRRHSWIGHTIRHNEFVVNILEGATSGKRAVGRPRLQYLKQVARNTGADSCTAMKDWGIRRRWRRRRRRRRRNKKSTFFSAIAKVRKVTISSCLSVRMEHLANTGSQILYFPTDALNYINCRVIKNTLTLSYRVPVRERYGSTLLPATREQHDQNCTQSH